MTGAGTSISRTGYPDIGLTTMSEMVANAAAIARTVSVPVIADADTGYGDVLQVRRTVREYERAGVAGIHIEDQESPKRCGHLDDKRVVPAEEMVRKLHAALDAREDDDFTIIARCDALAVTGWDDALRRCEAYVESGRGRALPGGAPDAGAGGGRDGPVRRARALQLRRDREVSRCCPSPSWRRWGSSS